MKIRIKDNSLRLRLTQGEVKEVASSGCCKASIQFPGGHTLNYMLEASGDQFEASLEANTIRVKAPVQSVKKWLEPTEVGMESWLELAGEDRLRILIEKDFACLTERVDEDESDNFPNPLAHC